MCILRAYDLTRGVLSVRYQSGINQNLYENDYDYFVFIIKVLQNAVKLCTIVFQKAPSNSTSVTKIPLFVHIVTFSGLSRQ